MQRTSQLFFIHCVSPVHVGAGQGIGIIDMPIIRERVTEWPYIPGSTSKGAHREEFRRNGGDDEWLRSAFGSRSEDGLEMEDSGNAGSLVFSDAKMLAFPVASVYGIYAYVTCPLVLRRLEQDSSAVGLPINSRINMNVLENFTDEEVLIADQGKSVVVNQEGKVELDEFTFSAKRCTEVTKLAQWIGAQVGSSQSGMANMLEQRLIIVSDNAFQYFVTMCCEIVPRIRIDHHSKTASRGALWQEEYIPAEALLYGLLWSDHVYSGHSNLTPQLILNKLQGARTLQIGGNASVGKGLVNYFTGNEVQI